MTPNAPNILLNLILLTSLVNVATPDKYYHKGEDLGDRIKVRGLSQEEVSGLYGGPHGYHDPFPDLSYTGHMPGYGGGQIPHYTYRIRDSKSFHTLKGEKKVGLVQKMFQKGMKKVTEKLLGVAEPVKYERSFYREIPQPRYVEVKVPKCKSQIEVAHYVTETLIKTKKHYVTKFVTETKKIKQKEYVVNTKTRTTTKTITTYIPQHVPPKTVYKTVSVGDYHQPQIASNYYQPQTASHYYQPQTASHYYQPQIDSYEAPVYHHIGDHEINPEYQHPKGKDIINQKGVQFEYQIPQIGAHDDYKIPFQIDQNKGVHDDYKIPFQIDQNKGVQVNHHIPISDDQNKGLIQFDYHLPFQTEQKQSDELDYKIPLQNIRNKIKQDDLQSLIDSYQQIVQDQSKVNLHLQQNEPIQFQYETIDHTPHSFEDTQIFGTLNYGDVVLQSQAHTPPLHLQTDSDESNTSSYSELKKRESSSSSSE